MKFAVLSRPRTQGILDGTVKFAGLQIDWHAVTAPLSWRASPDQPGGGMLSGGFDSGEMSISSFVQSKSQGAPIIALPVFLKRGLVQRSLFCAVDSPLRDPGQLQGRRVGLVGYVSSMALWVRGVLNEEYDLPRSSVAWFAVTPSSRESEISPTLLEIPGNFTVGDIEAWEELDGYPHRLDRRECFLLSLLEKRELDAVVSFHPKIASPKIRPLLPTEDEFWSHYRRTGIYPINHLFVLRREIARQFPDIAAVLLAGFKKARRNWSRYLADAEREITERECERLGWDPFAYQLTEVEKRTLERFIAYLDEEGLLSGKLSVDELFL